MHEEQQAKHVCHNQIKKNNKQQDAIPMLAA